MRLDPDHVLAPNTVEAIHDLFVAPETPGISDSDILRLALGIADDSTRTAFVRTSLDSPTARLRLVRAISRVSEEMGGGTPKGDELADLGRLRVFAGPFSGADASSVFPERFCAPIALDRLARNGWLTRTEEGRYAVSRTLTDLVPLPPSSEGWPKRLVERYGRVALRIDRLIAEGRWLDGSETLRVDLPNLRSAWRRVGEDHEAAELFVRSLMVPLIEGGYWDDFREIADLGRRVAKATGPKLLRLVLSYEGVASSRCGDSSEAIRLWSERLRLAREAGNRAVEADTLLDLAAQAFNDGDWPGWNGYIEEAEIAVGASARPDLEANLLAAKARERVAGGDLERATDYARRALAVLDGVSGVDFGLFVRASMAKTLVLQGDGAESSRVLINLLERCVEGGRALIAADTLADLASVLVSERWMDLAERCLGLSYAIHRELGSRHVDEARNRLASFRASVPEGDIPFPDGRSWSEESLAILREMQDWRPVASSR